jgi:hypothetical protein
MQNPNISCQKERQSHEKKVVQNKQQIWSADMFWLYPLKVMVLEKCKYAYIYKQKFRYAALTLDYSMCCVPDILFSRVFSCFRGERSNGKGSWLLYGDHEGSANKNAPLGPTAEPWQRASLIPYALHPHFSWVCPFNLIVQCFHAYTV